MLLLWAELLAIAAAIVVCGTQLSKYGDIIAEKTGLGGAWTGLILMASITSLPEMINGASSIAFAGLPDIAAGDLFGSCVFNLMILAILDPLDRASPIFSKVGQSHLLAAGFGVALIAVASFSILASEFMPSFLHIGASTLVIFAVYIAGVRMTYFYEKRQTREPAAENGRRYDGVTLKRALAIYSINALIVVSVAAALPFVAGSIADATGLGDSFVGTVFVAITTSLPELVVSISALRIGAHDMATGNILGSNMFNIALLGLNDLLYTKGPILSHISRSHAVTGLMAILMTAIVIISITYKPGKKNIRFGWDSMAMLAIGALNMYLVYLMG